MSGKARIYQAYEEGGWVASCDGCNQSSLTRPRHISDSYVREAHFSREEALEWVTSHNNRHHSNLKTLLKLKGGRKVRKSLDAVVEKEESQERIPTQSRQELTPEQVQRNSERLPKSQSREESARIDEIVWR